MTQTQIVQTLAEKCEITNKISKAMMNCLAQTAIAEVTKNGVFVVPGIGRLVRMDRKARMGRNPATGLWPSRTGLDPSTKTPRRSPGSRACCFSACAGSKTTQDRTTARVNAAAVLD